MPYFILKSKRVFFIHVPKAAGSTIKNQLAALGGARFDEPFAIDGRKIWPRHQPGGVLEAIFDPGMFDFVFMVVRHPVARLVSEYRYQRRKSGLHLANFLGFGPWLRYNLFRFRGNPSWRDHHFRPQVSFESLGCRVFHLEDGLAAPFAALADVTGIRQTEDPPRTNASARIPVRVSEKDLRCIARVYHADFERYGYEVAIPGDL